MVVRLRVGRKPRKGIKDRLTALFRTPPPKVAVGFPASKVAGSVVERAIFNEFGTRGGRSGGGWGGPIPERPFMRNAMRNNKDNYAKALKASAAKVIRGQVDQDTVLSKLGILAQGDIQMEITTLASPPNSPLTIELKGSSNPLIDTGEMRQAVTWEIER